MSKSRKRNCGRSMTKAKTTCGLEARIITSAVGKLHRGCNQKGCSWA